MIGSMVVFRKEPMMLVLARLIGACWVCGGVNGVRDMVALIGLDTWWHQWGWGCGGVDGVNRFRYTNIL